MIVLLIFLLKLQDVIKKMVCPEPSRDCFMGQCLRCVHNVDSLKEQVLDTFNDLEFDEVFFSFFLFTYIQCTN